MRDTFNPYDMLRMSGTKPPDSPFLDDGVGEFLRPKIVTVEFTCPEEFDLSGLQVFDKEDNVIMPVMDEKTGEPRLGIYTLQPGDYYYNFETGIESYRNIEHKHFTVEKDQKNMEIPIRPEEVPKEEDAEGSETEGSEENGTGEQERDNGLNVEVITPEPTEMVADPAREVKEGSHSPGLWTGALIGLLIGAALACVVMRLLQKLSKKKNAARGAKLRVQAKAVQGVGARQDQQDSLYMSDGRLYERQGILMCVADGMGGLNDGAKISQAVVSAVEQGFGIQEKDDPERLIFTLTKQALDAANQAVSPNFGSGGSTLVLGYLCNGEFTFSSVGDSRISLYRDGTLWHLNRRHVYEDELKVSALNGGTTYETAIMDKKKGALTSYLGMGKVKYTDMPDARIALRRGDRIILMSDGVFNTLSDEELAAILSRKIGTVTGAIAEQIKARANRYQDNFTAIVVAVD